jgi:hypothetical protein
VSLEPGGGTADDRDQTSLSLGGQSGLLRGLCKPALGACSDLGSAPPVARPRAGVEPPFDGPRDSEVENDGHRLRVSHPDENIASLEVALDHALLVRVLAPLAYSDEEARAVQPRRRGRCRPGRARARCGKDRCGRDARRARRDRAARHDRTLFRGPVSNLPCGTALASDGLIYNNSFSGTPIYIQEPERRIE